MVGAGHYSLLESGVLGQNMAVYYKLEGIEMIKCTELTERTTEWSLKKNIKFFRYQLLGIAFHNARRTTIAHGEKRFEYIRLLLESAKLFLWLSKSIRLVSFYMGWIQPSNCKT